MRYLLLITLLSIAFSTNAQVDDKPVMIEDRPLKWSDFKGHEVLDTFHGITYTNIEYEPKTLVAGATLPKFKSNAYFWSGRSTVSKAFLMNNPDSVWQRLLDHEQLHYDISRIGAAELTAIYDHFPFDAAHALAQADSLRAMMIRRINKVNRLYDKETRHSKDRKEQTRWNKLVADGMKTKQLPAVTEK